MDLRELADIRRGRDEGRFGYPVGTLLQHITETARACLTAVDRAAELQAQNAAQVDQVNAANKLRDHAQKELGTVRSEFWDMQQYYRNAVIDRAKLTDELRARIAELEEQAAAQAKDLAKERAISPRLRQMLSECQAEMNKAVIARSMDVQQGAGYYDHIRKERAIEARRVDRYKEELVRTQGYARRWKALARHLLTERNAWRDDVHYMDGLADDARLRLRRGQC